MEHSSAIRRRRKHLQPPVITLLKLAGWCRTKGIGIIFEASRSLCEQNQSFELLAS